MKFRHLSTVRLSFCFQKRLLLGFLGIGFILTSLFSTVRAEGARPQISAEDSTQQIKLAEKFAKKGDLKEAERILRRAIDADSDDLKVKLSLSYVLLKQRRFLDSYAISVSVAKADAKSARAYALVGMALLSLGDFTNAKTILENSLKLDRNEGLGWFGLGMLDFYENRIQKSVNKLEGAALIEYDDPDITFSLAQVYARAEKYKEAAETYNHFLQVSPPSDIERRERIKGLIAFLGFLGNKQQLYTIDRGVKQVELPIELMRDRPIVEVRINNNYEKLRFVLDTGSGISVISQETADRLKIKPVSKGGTARAVGGDGKFNIIYGFLKSVNFGELKIRNVPVYIRKFHDDGEKVDGYIGLSLISKFLTTVDYGNAKFTLTKKDTVVNDNFEKDDLALPLRLTSSGFLSGEVHIPSIDIPLNFIVDTGASISVISSDLAGSAEMRPFSISEKMRVIGAAGVTENVSSFLLPKVTFGKHSRDDIKAIALNLTIINEASGFQQTGILGGNFLKNYCVTFDFEKSKVNFVLNK